MLVCVCSRRWKKKEKCQFLLKEKKKNVSFYWTYVWVRAILTFVRFFYEPFPYLASLPNPIFPTEFNQIYASDEIQWNQRNPPEGRKEGRVSYQITPHICHNHHNRWLCKKFQSSVKMFNGDEKETAQILQKCVVLQKVFDFTQIV